MSRLSWLFKPDKYNCHSTFMNHILSSPSTAEWKELNEIRALISQAEKVLQLRQVEESRQRMDQRQRPFDTRRIGTRQGTRSVWS